MRGILMLTVTALLSSIAIHTSAEASPKAVSYVRQIGAEAIQLGATGSHAGFCRLVKKATDTSYMATWVLGDYLNQATPAQLKTIKNLIDDLLVKHLSEAFQKAAGGELRVYDRTIPLHGDVYVDAQLFDASGRSRYNFEFRIFQPDSNPIIIDAKISRTLISRYLLNDYTNFMRRHGGDQPVSALIDHLRGENPACP